MRKTKIVCTLGPATDREGVLRQMLEAGMNVARFNFSHGTHEEHLEKFRIVDRLREELGFPIGTMLDTKGPEIRIKAFRDGPVSLERGAPFILTTEEVEGDAGRVSVTYQNLANEVEPGCHILVDDGLVDLLVKEVRGPEIHCEVENGGVLSNNKSINIPNVHIHLPALTEKDREDLRFAAEQDFDYVAASFVRKAEDVEDIREELCRHGGQGIRIISKIENLEGVDNLNEIIEASDGLMVARGDLGVEVPACQVPVLQKEMIAKCIHQGKPVITATQMLDSMITNPRPTRAEITDVANAVYDGTSAIMLSGETAAGKYPVEAVQTMAAIAERTEADINYFGRMRNMTPDIRLGIGGATAHAACTTATDTNASAIITVTKSGATPRLISRFRPETPIVACVMDEPVQRQLSLTWGVKPIIMDYVQSTDEMIEGAVSAAQKAGLIHDGEIAVVTAGVPAGIAGTTNMIKVHLVGSSLINGAGVGDENVKGVLCVCRTLEDVRHKFHPGMILVVPHTNNEMLPYIRQAVGVITEENGLGSHAAVVGLSLNKAVIVGAIGATRTLHDGMKVSMDCRQGSVQSLAE